jgi:hypothetical protein
LLVTIRRQTWEADDEGNVVAWGEHVSDEQYAQAPSLTEGES